MRIRYENKEIKGDRLAVVEQADRICAEYADQGIVLTLRQLYYQFVARDLIPNAWADEHGVKNTQKNYDRLGQAMTDARMRGYLDWEYLIDRTRNVVSPAHWDSPQDRLREAARRYRADLWRAQHHRVEVWIEKDAAIGVVESVCFDNAVPYFSCRGYTSMSEMWEGAQRIGNYLANGERVTILHIGDHDPSGLDMTRDIRDRLATFITNDWYRSATYAASPERALTALSTNERIRASMRGVIAEAGGWVNDEMQPWRVKRIALSREQIDLYQPPPNPAKQTDARFARYVETTGLTESWELDALEPSVLQGLILDALDEVRDDNTWAGSVEEQEEDRQTITNIAEHWDHLAFVQSVVR